jgi:hypothetical protein
MFAAGSRPKQIFRLCLETIPYFLFDRRAARARLIFFRHLYTHESCVSRTHIVLICLLVTRTRGEALRKVKSPPKFARAGRPSARRCAHSHRAHPCTRSASARHCRHLDAAHLSIPLHPSRDDVVLSDDDPPSLGATSPLAPARCDGAPPVPPAGAPGRCPPGDPRWPPGAPLAPPSVTLSVPPGAARCRASVALSSHAWRRAARAHRTKPIFRFRYFCLIRARDENPSSKCSRAKTDFPAVFADDSKFSSFVRKICYTAELTRRSRSRREKRAPNLRHL